MPTHQKNKFYFFLHNSEKKWNKHRCYEEAITNFPPTVPSDRAGTCDVAFHSIPSQSAFPRDSWLTLRKQKASALASDRQAVTGAYSAHRSCSRLKDKGGYTNHPNGPLTPGALLRGINFQRDPAVKPSHLLQGLQLLLQVVNLCHQMALSFLLEFF